MSDPAAGGDPGKTPVPMPIDPPPTPIPRRPEFWNVQFFLMLAVIIMMAALLYIFAYHEVPEKNKDVFTNLSSNITSAFMLMIGYFWGSSKSSRDKDDVIASNTKGTAP